MASAVELRYAEVNEDQCISLVWRGAYGKFHYIKLGPSGKAIDRKDTATCQAMESFLAERNIKAKLRGVVG